MKQGWAYLVELWIAMRGGMYVHVQPPRPCPPEITSDLGRQLWAIIDAFPFDREAYDRALAPHQPRFRAAECGAAHELGLYGGEGA